MKYEVIKNTSNSCVGAKGWAIAKNKQIIPGWFETKSLALQHLSTLNLNAEPFTATGKRNWFDKQDQDQAFIDSQCDQEYPYK